MMFEEELHIANRTDIPFSIEGKNVVLDDLLFMEEQFVLHWMHCYILAIAKS